MMIRQMGKKKVLENLSSIWWLGSKPILDLHFYVPCITAPHKDFLCSDRSNLNLMRWWILVIVTFLGINSDKITKSKDLSIKVIWEIILMEMKKSARRRHCSKIIKTNLKTHISPLPNRPQGCQGYQKNQKDLRITTMHYRKKYDKYMNFSTGWYACKVFLPPLGAIILNFSTMVQLTL